MTDLFPTSLQTVEQYVLSQFGTKTWRFIHTELTGGSDDPLLDRLIHLRFMYHRAWMGYNMYRQRYWNEMDIMHRLVAEAKSEYYADAVRDLFALERLRLLDSADFDSQLSAAMSLTSKSIDDMILGVRKAEDRYAAQMQNHFNNNSSVLQDTDIEHLRLRLGVLGNLIPANSLQNLRELQSLISKTYDESNRASVATAGADDIYQTYRDHLAHVTHEVHSAYNLLTTEISDARIAANTLTGNAAKDRTLLVNDAIPLPTIHTIAAWAHLCSLRFIALTVGQSDALKPLHDDPKWQPTHILTVVPPLMPVTKEHRSGGIQSDEMNTTHSLPARSGGHARTKNGGIDHGFATAQTWAIDCVNNMVALITMEQCVETDVTHRFEHHKHLLPLKIRGEGNDDLWQIRDHEFYATIPGVVGDPYLHGGSLLSVEWSNKYPVDTPWRWMARHNLHFRFDNGEVGEGAITRWVGAYLATMMEWVRLDEIGRINNRLEASMILDRWTPNTVTAIKSGDTVKRFDFSGLSVIPKK